MATSLLAVATQALLSPGGLSLIFFVLVAPLLYIWYKKQCISHQVFERLEIPGPRPLPLVGNLLPLLVKGELNMYKEWLETYGPICGFYTGDTPSLLIADIDMAQCIYSTKFKNFMDRKAAFFLNSRLAGLPLGMFECGDPSEWKRVRQITSLAFTNLKLKALAVPVEHSCDLLLDMINERNCGKSVDMTSLYQAYALEVAFVAVFGHVIEFQKGEGAEFLKAIASVTNLCHGKFFFTLPLERSLASKLPCLVSFLSWLSPGGFLHEFKVVKRMIRDQINARRNEQAKQSVLDLLLRASEKQSSGLGEDKSLGLGEDNIVSHCLNFLMAAYDTTSFSLAICSFLLATHPAVQDKLCHYLDQYWKKNPDASAVAAAQDVPYLDMVVSESLRMHPVAPRLGRECSESTVVGRVEIPKGTFIITPTDAFHYNKEVWGDPEVFRPERFSEEEMTTTHHHHFMPFGQGPRNCIGFRLAMIEMKTALATLLREHRFMPTCDNKDSLQIECFSFTVSTKDPLFLVLQQRK